MKTKDINKIAKDIISIKLDKSDTLEICMNKFFDVMRKYGIKEGTIRFDKNGKSTGRICDNPEWCICKSLFFRSFENFLELQILFGNCVPEDLLG